MSRLLATLLLIAIIIATAAAGTDYQRLEGPPDWGRPHLFDMIHTKLEVSFDEADKKVIGRATLTLQPLVDNFTQIELDAEDLSIESVKLANDRQLKFQSYPEKLLIELDRPYTSKEKISFSVSYQCHPRAGVFFVGPDEKFPNKPHQIWTQGEMMDNRRWFPGYDYPNDRATSEMLLTVKEQYTAVSNGRLLDVKSDAKAHTRTFHWRLDKPHVNYLISFVVGEFVELKDQFENIPVSFFVNKRHEQDAPRSFANTVKMIKFFSERINYRYPYDKYAQVVVTDFTVGGQENITATTLTEETIHPASVDAEMSSEGLVAHELAHQWWGDLVTCRDWPHLWLNEGFATFFQILWTEHSRGNAEAMMERVGDFGDYQELEAEKYRRPIVHNRYPDADQLFDAATYQKGGLVLNMLRWLLGEERFWKGIDHYIHKFELQVVDTNDFRIAMEEASGENLGWFFDEWVYKAGYPEFEIQYDWNEQTKLIHLNIKQTQTVDDLTPIYRTPVDIEVVTAAGAQLRRIEINKQEQDYYLPADTRPLMIHFDKTGAIIKTVKFNRPIDQILYQLEKDPSEWGRVEAAMELKGYANDEAVVNVLARSLQQDKFWGVRAKVAETLGSSQLSGALTALIAGYRDSDFHVRSEVVKSVANWREDRAVELLVQAIAGDGSVTVVGDAAGALGKTASPRAYEILVTALGRDSHREVIRAGALSGLGRLKDLRALPLLLKWSEYGNPPRARTSAIRSLGQLGKGDPAVVKYLTAQLTDASYQVRRASADALKELADQDAAAALSRQLNIETDHSVRYSIRNALARLERLKRAATQ